MSSSSDTLYDKQSSLPLIDKAVLYQINRLDKKIDDTRELYFELKELIFSIMKGGKE